MKANDAILFIDSNVYLSLFRASKGQLLLKTLVEQRGYIFVTSQIVNEVRRNKLTQAKEFLSAELGKVERLKFAFPEHFSGTAARELRKRKRELARANAAINRFKGKLDETVSQMLDQISKSQDGVSKLLDKIFRNPVTPTPQELQRARDRKELGNPPGKLNGPIGDQLNWEQFLNHCKANGKSRLWIITRDSDYIIEQSGKTLLNPFLYEELKDVKAVHCFTDPVKGIAHFATETGIGKAKLPAKKERESMSEEWQQFNNVAQDWEFQDLTNKPIPLGNISIQLPLNYYKLPRNTTFYTQIAPEFLEGIRQPLPLPTPPPKKGDEGV